MDFNSSYITKSPEETANVGTQIAAKIVSARLPGKANENIYCLYGELGSGKTTFVQGFARGLGLTSRILSPTFILMRRYAIPGTGTFFYHIDLYRLTGVTDIAGLGLDEIYGDSASIVIIEWAERLAGSLPESRTDMHFFTNEDGSHRINVQRQVPV